MLFLRRLKGLLSTPSKNPKPETLTVKNALLEALDEHNTVRKWYFHILSTVRSKLATQIPNKKLCSKQYIVNNTQMTLPFSHIPKFEGFLI